VSRQQPDLRRGRIVWARLRDRNGIAKERPALMITAASDITLHEPFEVMAITITFPNPPPDNCIQLPWHPQGRAATKLRQRSAAVISWIDEIRADDILHVAGDVPPRFMIEIMNRLV
jgi:hypothetical protein